ncbi:MAG: hypothetical protein ACE149_01125 [Armatimonadota bacterium]
MSELLHLRITDETTLMAAADLLHDGVFDPADVVHDADRFRFTLTAWRELDPHLSWLGFIVNDRWGECRLVLRQVAQAEISLDEQGLWSLFEEAAYDAAQRQIQLKTLFVKIRLQVSAIDGELVDTGGVTDSDPQRRVKRGRH